jgi:hypothetical protein
MISLKREDIARACSSNKFAERLAEQSPFVDDASLLKISKQIWWDEVSADLPCVIDGDVKPLSFSNNLVLCS